MKKRVHLWLELEEVRKVMKIAKLNGGTASSVIRYALTKLGDPVEVLKAERKGLIAKANELLKKINDLEDRKKARDRR